MVGPPGGAAIKSGGFFARSSEHPETIRVRLKPVTIIANRPIQPYRSQLNPPTLGVDEAMSLTTEAETRVPSA